MLVDHLINYPQSVTKVDAHIDNRINLSESLDIY